MTHYETMKKALKAIGIKFQETNYEAQGECPNLKGLLITEDYIDDKLLEHLFTEDGKHYRIQALFQQGHIYLP